MGYQVVDIIPSQVRRWSKGKKLIRRKKTDLQLRVEEFVDMNVKAAEFINWDSYYVTLASAQNAISKRCRNENQSYPVKAVIRSGKIYLERTDM